MLLLELSLPATSTCVQILKVVDGLTKSFGLYDVIVVP